MARHSPFVIRLSHAEEASLAKKARHRSSQHRDYVRSNIVLMAASGMDNTTIAARLGVDRKTVSRWRKRFFEERLDGIGSGHGPVDPGAFPPEVVVTAKAIACGLPRRTKQPVSRLHAPDIRAELIERGIVESISAGTIWRWLEEDALKPWKHRTWIYPRDPDFGVKAAPALDLYQSRFDGVRLEAEEFVLSSDEKTSIQARVRCHVTVAGTSRHPMLVEHEYDRAGAFAYLAAWDVHRAKLFGRFDATTGIEPFGRLVEQVMGTEPYRSARRVF